MKRTSYQDAHLDLLIRMAFEQLDEEDTEQLAASPDPELSAADALRADKAFDTACSKVGIQEKQEKNKKRNEIIWHGFRTIGFAAAAIVILALIALPVTFAASAEFRQAVMKLFVEIDEERGEAFFSFHSEEEKEEKTQFDDATAPDFWKGGLYPQYLPEGFTVSQTDDLQFDVTYTAPDGRSIRFTEKEGSMPHSVIPENAEYHKSEYGYNDWAIWEETINDQSQITVYQDQANSWCRLITLGVGREETLKITNSVRNVMHDVHFDSYQRGHLLPETEATAPDYWTGDYYIAWLPEGLWRDGVYNSNCVHYQDANKRELLLNLYDEKDDFFVNIEESDFQIISIHGWDAYLLTEADEEVSTVSLYWQEEEAWLSIYAYDIPVEQVLKIAESTKRLHRDEGFDPMVGQRIQYDEGGRALPLPDWKGEFFPGWLPEGFTMISLSNNSGIISFAGENNRGVTLNESIHVAMTIPSLMSYSTVRLVDINGRQGLLLMDDKYNSERYELYWDDGNYNWFNLDGWMVSEDEMLRVAKSIYRIGNGETLGDEPSPSYEAATAAVPDCWNGNYYPAYVPAGFEVSDYVDFFHSIELVSEDDRRILFSELDETIVEMRGTEGATVDTILIQGREATIIDGWHNNIHNVTIVWPADDDHTWFDLVTYGIETEETVHIAESVTKIDKQ